jgi:hypothetical protein
LRASGVVFLISSLNHSQETRKTEPERRKKYKTEHWSGMTMLHTSSSQPTMTSSITLTITDAGRAAAISADGMGLRLVITHAALGRGAYEPQSSQTRLVSRVERVSVTNIASTAPAATARFAASFPALAASAQSYSACELGLYAGDPDLGGVLFAVYSNANPIVVRGAFDYLIAFGMALSGVPAGSVTVQIDPDAAPFLALLGEHDRDSGAHAALARKDDLSMQAYTSGTTTGSGSEYSLAMAVPPKLAMFARVACKVHATNTGATTLAVGSLLPRAVKVYGADGVKADPDYGRMAAGMLADLEFDGTDWVLLNPIPAPVMTSIRPANVTLTPAQSGGNGTEGSPLLLPDATSSPGATSAAVAAVRVTGLRPGEIAMVADLGDTANGARFSLGSLASRVASGAGVVVLPIVFADLPASAVGTSYMMDLSINGLRIRHRRTIASAATISAPVISAPLADATNQGLRPTINVGAFLVTGGAASHTSTDWQISMSQTFDSLFVRSELDTVNKLSWLPPSLAYSTTFYVRARFNGASVSSNWSAPVRFSTQAEPAVSIPALIYPMSGATGIAVSPRFSCTAFAVTGTTDTHKSSDWQISTTADFSSIVTAVVGSISDLTAWAPVTALSYTTAYYVRVRHTATGLGASAWSVPVSFATGASTPIVATPSVTSPLSGASGVKGPFMSGPFALASGADTHASSDWQIGTTSTFAAIVSQTSGDVSAKTSWTPATLPRGTYFVRVRHNGVLAGASPWSAAVAFTWIATTKPTITAPVNGATNVDQGLTVTASPFASSGSDRLVSSDWQASLVADFSTLVFAYISISSTTSWLPANLSPSTRYYLRVRQNGEAGGSSDWSNTVSFTTAAATGITWSPAGTNGAGVLRGIAFGGTKLVAVGSSTIGAYGTGSIVTSLDAGLTWTNRVEAINGKRIGTPYSVIYTGSRWVAVGYDIAGDIANCAACVSTDGITWAEYSTGSGLLRDIAWDGSKLACVGVSTSLYPVLKTSPNGMVWTDGVSLTALCGSLLTIEWAPQLGLWIAGGMTTAYTEASGAILTSPDLVTWTRCILPADVGVINKIVWNGSMGVAVGMTSAASLGAGIVLTTTDGVNWVRRSLLCGALYGIEWALSKWIACGYTRAGTESAGEAWTSADGVTWTSRTTGSGRLLALCQASAANTPGPVVAVGFTPAGLTSAGGIYRS